MSDKSFEALKLGEAGSVARVRDQAIAESVVILDALTGYQAKEPASSYNIPRPSGADQPSINLELARQEVANNANSDNAYYEDQISQQMTYPNGASQRAS